MTFSQTRGVYLAGYFLFMILALPAAAQPMPAELASDFEARITAIEQDPSLTDAIKTRAIHFYTEAIGLVREVERSAAQTDALTKRIMSAPERIEQLHRTLEQAPSDEAASLPAPANDEDLRQALNDSLSELQTGREALTGHQRALIELRAAGSTLSDAVAELEQAIRSEHEEQQTSPPEQEPTVLTQARRAFLSIRLELTQSRLAFERQRLAGYELLLELQTLERDVSEQHVNALQQTVAVLDTELQRRREASARVARDAAEAAQADTGSLPPAVTAIAANTARLRQELEALVEQDNEAQRRLRAMEQQLDKLQRNVDSLRQRIDTGIANTALVRLLRQYLQSLPSLDNYPHEQRQRQTEIHRVTERRLGLDQRRIDLHDLDARTEVLLNDLGTSLSTSQERALREHSRQLLTAQRDALAELDQGYGRYLTRLTSVDVVERKLIGLVQEGRRFIEDQLLWMRTLPLLSPTDLQALPQALRWLLSPEHWAQTLLAGYAAARARPLLTLAGIMSVIAVFGLRRWTRRRLRELARLTYRVRDDRFSHTIKALGYSVLLASGLPLLLALSGWLIKVGPPPTSGALFTSATGNALLIAAAVLWICSLARVRSIPDGLDLAHFRWPDSLVSQLDRRWRAASLPLAAAAFIVMAIMYSNEVDYIRALGRPVSILTLLGIAVFFWLLYKVLAAHQSQQPQQVTVEGLRARWVLPLIAATLALTLILAIGYHSLALKLAHLFGASLALLLGLIVLKDLLLRWVYVTERRLRLEAALRQREEMRTQREQEPTQSEAGDFFEVEEPKLDYRELGQQGRNLVRAGLLLGLLFGIGSLWSELVPVVGFLSGIDLPLTRSEVVDGIIQPRPLTLADLTLALLILVVTVYALRNLAGLLELTVLRRAALDAGGRYALVTLSKYMIGAVGVISTLSILGLDWSKLQWLVAALGVGLGFGLQEIVANFVCGIILLLERPVRVGDIVTVSDTDGTVARINIRATTIITWERKELVVPNKEFITSKVLNWTLSDPETRLLIVVGIAYGSNVKTARELMLEAAAEVEPVLDEPKPSVTFAGFGDNALNLELRCYIPSMDYYLSAQTALHDAIYEKFNGSGISIAFPQRDVHLDAAEPIEVRLQT